MPLLSRLQCLLLLLLPLLVLLQRNLVRTLRSILPCLLLGVRLLLDLMELLLLLHLQLQL